MPTPTKESIIAEWLAKSKEGGSPLWRGAAKEIAQIIDLMEIQKAIVMLHERAQSCRQMAISVYYEGAAKDVAELITQDDYLALMAEAQSIGSAAARKEDKPDDEKRLAEIDIILTASPWVMVEGQGVVSKSVAAQEKFLAELASESNKPIDELIQAGYLESIPLYLQDGKTPKQVANTMASAARHGMRG
jgi:hypothetical protein